jgi:hypothetical protein
MQQNTQRPLWLFLRDQMRHDVIIRA